MACDTLWNTEWLNRTFRMLVLEARKKKVDPKNIPSFMKFLRESRNDRINWAASTVDAFARWAGEEYEGFVNDVTV